MTNKRNWTHAKIQLRVENEKKQQQLRIREMLPRKESNFCCFTHHQQPRINKVKGHSSIEMDVSLP